MGVDTSKMLRAQATAVQLAPGALPGGGACVRNRRAPGHRYEQPYGQWRRSHRKGLKMWLYITVIFSTGDRPIHC